MHAAERGLRDIVVILVENGADVQLEDAVRVRRCTAVAIRTLNAGTRMYTVWADASAILHTYSADGARWTLRETTGVLQWSGCWKSTKKRAAAGAWGRRIWIFRATCVECGPSPLVCSTGASSVGR
jgi:hypothetical protein